MKETSLGMKIALLLMLIAFGYLTAVTFIPMPIAGAEHSKTIVGFLLGTVFSTLINYYWGNSSKGKPPDSVTTTIQSSSTTEKNFSDADKCIKEKEELKE